MYHDNVWWLSRVYPLSGRSKQPLIIGCLYWFFSARIPSLPLFPRAKIASTPFGIRLLRLLYTPICLILILFPIGMCFYDDLHTMLKMPVHVIIVEIIYHIRLNVRQTIAGNISFCMAKLGCRNNNYFLFWNAFKKK